MSKAHPIYLGLLTLFIANTGWASRSAGGPSSASAGIIEQQIEQEFNVKGLPEDRPVPLLEIDIPEKKLHIPEGISAFIDHIYLEGNTLLSAKEVNKAFFPYLHRELTGQDVITLCKEIECLYAKKGYILAWVYPPVQVIENNTLRLQALEGFLDEIHVTGNTSYKTSFIKKYVSGLKGKPLNYNDLTKALRLMNENIDLETEAILKKGSQVGSIDLVIKIQDQFPAHMNIGYNNWGSNVLTYNQLSSEIRVGNLLTSGDLLSLMTSVGIPAVMYYFNPVYSVPINGLGTRCDLSYLFTHSYIQELKPLGLACWSELAGIAFIHPLSRTRTFAWDITTEFKIKQYKNFIEDITATYDKLRVVSLGTNLEYLDLLRGRNFINAFARAGIPYILNGSAPIDPKCSRIGGGGRYFILNVGYQRVQTLPFDTSLLFTSMAQGSFNKLPLSEQFTIGGVGSVRGYPAAIASGDIGYYLNAELYAPVPGLVDRISPISKKKWKETLQLLAFLDHGGVYTNTPVPSEFSPAYLTAVGVGIRFYGPRDLNISFDVAFPLTNTYKLFNSFLYIRVITKVF
ncbi:MAG: ShlB/FhaC/HecB family hemolysin secretion/activation protein [Chlamydiota bacterium]